MAPSARRLRIDAPILQIVPSETVDAPDNALVDELPSILDCRRAPIAEADQCFHARLRSRLPHVEGFLGIHCDRLLDQNMFPGADRLESDLPVGVRRSADIDKVDVGP